MNQERTIIGSIVKTGLLCGLLTYLAYRSAHAIMAEDYNIFIIIIAIFCLLASVAKPVTVFILGFVVISRFFINYYIHIPGLFKSFDVGLMFCILSGLMIWIYKLGSRKDIFRGKLTRTVVLFALYIVLEMVYTVVIPRQSPVMTFQMGRFYLFMLIYFPAITFFFYYPGWVKHLKWLAAIGIFGSLLYVTQRTFNFGFLSAFFKSGGSNVVADTRVERLQSAVYGPSVFVSSIVICLLVTDNIKKNRMWYWIIAALPALHNLLSFARGSIVAYFAMMSTAVAISGAPRTTKLKTAVLSVIVIISFLVVTSIMRFGDPGKYYGMVSSRLYSAQQDFSAGSGTYEARGNLVQTAIERVIDYNPLLGVGFIHPDNRSFVNAWGITTGHSGYAVLINNLGLLGFFLYCIMMATIFNIARKTAKLVIPPLYRAFAATTSGFIVWGFLNMFSSSYFVLEMSFTYLGIFGAILQLARIKHEETEARLA